MNAHCSFCSYVILLHYVEKNKVKPIMYYVIVCIAYNCHMSQVAHWNNGLWSLFLNMATQHDIFDMHLKYKIKGIFYLLFINIIGVTYMYISNLMSHLSSRNWNVYWFIILFIHPVSIPWLKSKMILICGLDMDLYLNLFI